MPSLRSCCVALSRVVLVAGVAIAAALSHHPARADDDCPVTLSQAHDIFSRAKETNPDAVFTEYSGIDAKALMDEINSQPPVSHWDADAVGVIDFADGGTIRILLIVDDCVQFAFTAPRESWPDTLRRALSR